MTIATGGTFEIALRGGVPVLQWPIFDGFPLDAVVTTRHGGVSPGPYGSMNLGLHVGDVPDAVLENRRRAASLLGLGPTDLVFCNQAHGREVVVVGEEERGRGALSLDDAIGGADALVTTTPRLGLVVMVADCVPIVLFDPVGGVLACVHAGWRGTVARVSEATIEQMTALGSRPADIRAGIGPAIPVDRYQVGEEVADAARESFGSETSSVVRPDGTGRWQFDLWEANRLTLVQAGLDPRRIAIAALATGGEDFFSDRVERPCGRCAAVAAITGPGSG